MNENNNATGREAKEAVAGIETMESAGYRRAVPDHCWFAGWAGCVLAKRKREALLSCQGRRRVNKVTGAVLNSVIHAPNRLRICALLTPLQEAEFQLLRDLPAIFEVSHS
jgi:hypothetical protein